MHPRLFQILAVVKEAPAEALEILDRMERLGDSDRPSLPAFYRHLRKGLDEGWLCIVAHGEPSGRGRPRQTYALTPEGARALRERARELVAFTTLALGERGGEGG